MSDDPVLRSIALRALDFVSEGNIVGLGTGRAASAFVRALGERVAAGLRVRGVPTSVATEALAHEVKIPLVALDEVEVLDVAVDGADEVDPQLNLIKGYGGALVREKIIAAAARQLIILIGSEKLVQRLGERGKIPVEVVPFAVSLCRRRLAALGLEPVLRQHTGKPFVSDGGNLILDCGTSAIAAPQQLEDAIRAIPGVVGSGMFLAMTDCVLVGDGPVVREMRPTKA